MEEITLKDVVQSGFSLGSKEQGSLRRVSLEGSLNRSSPSLQSEGSADHNVVNYSNLERLWKQKEAEAAMNRAGETSGETVNCRAFCPFVLYLRLQRSLCDTLRLLLRRQFLDPFDCDLLASFVVLESLAVISPSSEVVTAGSSDIVNAAQDTVCVGRCDDSSMVEASWNGCQ